MYFIFVQLVLLASIPFGVQARDYFNPALLGIDNPNQGDTDLSVFEEGETQAPGTYRVDIYINNAQQETRDVPFRMLAMADGKESLQPCLSMDQLNEMGVKTELFPDLGDSTTECVNLHAIAQASAEFRFSAQQLLLSIPQAAMSQKVRGYVPESQWDNGISAFLFNYGLSGSDTFAGGGGNSKTQFANLRPGLNIGPWRLRNYTTWNNDDQSQWHSIYTYATRSIAPLKSQLALGDSTSPGDVFDSVPFRGVQLASDDDMIPDSQKGYAPVVRGIARTNAQVIIRQNGYVIYQTFVAPGAFEIHDMFPTGSSGDLRVTIKEADGSEQQLVVPFASLPVLQREGQLKYSLTAGQYRSYDSSVEQTPFGQGTAIYGLPQGFTAFGGSQFSSDYLSVSAGVGKNLGRFGAMSVDVTQANSTLPEQPADNGQSWRIRYNKNIVQTGTHVAVAGYRYSTDGYYSLQEVMDTHRSEHSPSSFERRRNRSELTMGQNLWSEAGSLSLNWTSEDYWNSNRIMRSVGVGYNNNWNGISYGLNYNYNENSTANDNGSGRIYDRDQVFALNISMPLSRWLDNTYASYNLSSSKMGGSANTAGINGTALAGKNLNWSLQQTHSNQGEGYGGNMNADYRGTYAEANAGYAYGQKSQRLHYGVQGGVVAHRDGITFGQQLGETITLVKAPGADGIDINGQTGVKTDWRGYAIVPYSTPYRKNPVQLNTESLPDNVELPFVSQNVVPTRGAVTRASFDTSIGQRVLMTLRRANGTPVPFGAIVNDLTEKKVQGFIVGDEGQVYLTGLTERGSLQVRWGSAADQQCQVSYSLMKKTDSTGVQMMDAYCR
jgi:outer membrane usher protein